MTRAAAGARLLAVAIAIAAAIDPAIPIPRAERPVVRIVSTTDLPGARDVAPIAQALTNAGFIINPAARETATVLIADHANAWHLARDTERPALSTDPTIWPLDTTPVAPNVRIASAETRQVRLPAQAVEVRVAIAADGVAGEATEVVVEDRGIPVARARHQWGQDDRRWQVSLHYLPPGAAATRLRVRAVAVPGETSADDNIADVAVPAMRGPIRVLIVEAGVTWPAMFARRALEGEPSFAVSSIQRASKAVITRAGGPPPALTRAALATFEAAFIGGPDDLSAADLDALRWFVEERGGVAIFVPDRNPTGRYVDLVGVSAFAPRALDAPVRVGPDLLGSELLIPSALPAAATVLAADASGSPVVFAARRGAGAIVFSGALDAWRQRATVPDQANGAQAGDGPFARFWRQLVVTNAATVPPVMEVSTDPAIVRPGQRTRIAVRTRASEIPSGDSVTLPAITGRAVGPAVGVDEPIRLWPTAEPGVYEGEWRPRIAGAYGISAVAGDLRADATLTVAPDVRAASNADPEGLALRAAASGGRVFPIDRVAALVEAMRAAHPPRRVVRPAHPMRSPWWLLPFAGLLCAEWAVRRKRGLP